MIVNRPHPSKMLECSEPSANRKFQLARNFHAALNQRKNLSTSTAVVQRRCDSGPDLGTDLTAQCSEIMVDQVNQYAQNCLRTVVNSVILQAPISRSSFFVHRWSRLLFLALLSIFSWKTDHLSSPSIFQFANWIKKCWRGKSVFLKNTLHCPEVTAIKS